MPEKPRAQIEGEWPGIDSSAHRIDSAKRAFRGVHATDRIMPDNLQSASVKPLHLPGLVLASSDRFWLKLNHSRARRRSLAVKRLPPEPKLATLAIFGSPANGSPDSASAFCKCHLHYSPHFCLRSIDCRKELPTSCKGSWGSGKVAGTPSSVDKLMATKTWGQV